ncbi:MAG: delta-60 repeat domain protein [Pedosphaera sp.]|nr:delta-60 repeat domain protein [Pedosphaera sp.]
MAGWIPAQGATVIWNGSVSSDWFNPANWTPVGLPASGDTVNFSSGSINLTAPVNFTGQFNWSGGTLSGNSLTIASNGVLNILGSVSLQGALTNNGTVNWQAGALGMYNNNGQPYTGAIWNQAGALWDIQCDQPMNGYYGYEQFHNAGLVRKSAGTNTTTMGFAFVNSGTVDTESGTTQFSGGETNTSGQFQTATNAAVSGNISGTFSGTLNWSGGGIAGGTSLTIASNGVLNIEGNVSLQGALTNYGTVNWQAGTVGMYNNNGQPYTAVIWNRAGALWYIQCDQAMNGYYGNEQFNNEGLVRKSAGTNTTTMGTPFTNSGTVDAESGMIQFSGGENNLNGQFQTATNATIGGNLTGTFTGTVNWSGGSLVGGTWLTIASSGVLNIQGNVSIYGSLTNFGRVNWQSGAVGVYNNNGQPYTGAIWNRAGALWDIQCDQAVNAYYGNEQFNNAGLIRKSASTNTTTMGIPFANSGTVDAESGTINFSGADSLGGNFQAAANAAIYFSGGSYTIIAGLNSQGPGPVQMTSGTVSGTLSGALNWSGGLLGAGSSLTVASNGVLNIQGSVGLLGALTNYGTVNWQAGSVGVYNNGGQPYTGGIWNQSGALWDIQCDQAVNINAGSPPFNNSGLLRKSAGTNTTSIGIPFTNTGMVVAQSGTINFSGTDSLGGSFQATANAAIYFSGGSFTVLSGLNFQGPGPVQITSGTIDGTFAGTVNWSGGQLGAGSSLTVASNGVLNIQGNISLLGALTNYGTVNWQAGTVGVYNNGGQPYTGAIWNQAGALWDIQCDQAVNINAGSPPFNNAGLLRKSAGTNTTTIGIVLNNTGTVMALEGTIGLNNGVSLTNGTLSFALSSPSNYGRINISGVASLAGGVSAVLLDGYVPAVGAQFNVMAFGSTNGTFADFSGLNAGSGIFFNASVTSTALTLQASATNFVAVTPAILNQPASQTVTYGGTATLNAVVSGSPVLNFQWYQNGSPVNGGTNTTLTLSNVQVSQAGAYTVSISNSAGGTVSQPATLTVLRAVPGLNWASPGSISYGTALGTNQLNAGASVPGTFVYSPPLGTVLNAGGNTLTVTFNPTDSLDYASIVGSVTISVSQAPLTATANNAGRTFGQTNPAFSGTITGLKNGDNISATYSCSATPQSPPGSYPIVPALVDPNGRQGNYSVTLVNGSLTVTPGPPPILISISPIVGPTNGGTVVTISGTGFEVGAGIKFGSLPASSVNVNGTNSMTAITPLSPVGLVNVIITNADGNTATLTNAFTFGIPASIQSQPISQAVLPGSNVQLQVQAAGALPLIYQWQFNGVNLLDYGGISGSHTATLTLNNVAPAQAGSYTVTVTNLFGKASSPAATLTVLVPPYLITAPQGLSAGVGATVDLSVAAAGSQPLSYQWYQNGSPLGGATSAVLHFASLQALNQGSYVVVVTNVAGTVSSTPVNLNVLAYCASAHAAKSVYPAGTTVPLSVQTFACGPSTPTPNSPAVVWIYEAGSSRSFPVTTDGSGNDTFNFTPLPGETGLCQFAAALPGQSPPPAQGSFTLAAMSLSSSSLSPRLIAGVPQTNMITLSNLTGAALSGITATVVGQPADVSVQVTAPSSLGGNASGQASLVLQGTGNSQGQVQFAIQFTSAEGTTNTLTLNMSTTTLVPQLVATPLSLNNAMVGGSQTLVSFSVANTGGAASGPMEVLLPSAPWLSLVTPGSIASLAPGASNQVTLALTPATTLPLGPYASVLQLISSNAQLQVPFTFNCVSSKRGALQVTAQDELSIYGTGSPNLSNATVVVTDFLTGTNVTNVVTDASGTVLFSNLVSAFYNVEVSAPDHGSFNTTLLVAADQTNSLETFLPLQLVDYTWIVTPTIIPDNYEFTLTTTFQTQVPWPVLTITPGAINLCSLNGDSNEIDLVITNNGLIAAQGLQFVVGTNTDWALQPLATNLGDLGAESSIVVPLIVKRLSANTNAASNISAQINWHVQTPTQSKYYATPIFVYNANPADCSISSPPILMPVPAPPPIQDTNQVGSAGVDSGAEGGGQIGTGSGPAYGSSPIFPIISPPTYNFDPPITGAIVEVKLQIDQTAIISRDVFNASLQLKNNSGSPITNLKLTINPTDAQGNPATNFFEIAPPKLAGLTAVDGTGSMSVGGSGSASWTIIPATNAAPSGKVQYHIGGTLSYVLNGQQVTIPLFPVPITVLPTPILSVDYFLEHDVYSNDPFTPETEPSIPVALGLLVKNSGQGSAYNFTITTTQPKIIENSNDLVIAFQLIGSQVGTNPSVSPSLTLNLGGIGPQGSAEGLWYMTSTLEGDFTSFSATYRHVDDFGHTNTSLISSLRTHEMNHVVRIFAPADDGLPDFLVNDTTNVDALPDIVYSSAGSTAPVTSLANASTAGAPSGVNSNVTLTASVPSGYVYLEVVDPGAGIYPIASVRRSDGVILLVGPNVWQTPARVHMVPPKPNNLIHIFDYNSTGSYTITYGLPIVPPAVSTLNALNITPTTASLNALVNPNGADTGVYFQWGATTNYGNSTVTTSLTSSLNSSQAVAIGLDGLPPNTTNHFRVVAANSAGTSYGEDLTVVTPPLPPPVITQVTNRFLIVGQNIIITNHAVAATPPVTYSLGGSAPAGATISSNGVFSWTPACAEGSSTNLITVWATDSSSPPLSNSMTFSVAVGECVQVGVGSTVMQVGTTSSVPVTLLSTVGITNLTFTLAAAANRFTNWAFVSSNASIATATVQATGSSPPVFILGTHPGQTLQSPALLGTIAFTALPGGSAFVPIAATNIIGLKSDGSVVGNITGLSGRVTVIGVQPLLEALPVTSPQHLITIYGNPGSNYQMAFSTNLVLTNWQPAGSVLMTNLQQYFHVNQTTPELYYRTQ